jgi:hypothetical protein
MSMNFFTTDNISLISLLCSVFALLVAVWTARYAHDAVRESRKTSLAANHQKYVELITNTKRSLDPQLGEFRTEASRIYPEILHLLDKFRCRSEGFLRHVAGRLCQIRTDSFSHKLQSGREFKAKRFPISLWELEMDEPETPEVKEVVEMVPQEARPKLYREIQQLLKPYWEAFDGLKPKLELAKSDLEAALQKSELEEYPLRLSPKICKSYLATIRTYRLLLGYDIFQARPEDGFNETAEGYEVSTLFYAVSVLMLVEQSYLWEKP